MQMRLCRVHYGAVENFFGQERVRIIRKTLSDRSFVFAVLISSAITLFAVLALT